MEGFTCVVYWRFGVTLADQFFYDFLEWDHHTHYCTGGNSGRSSECVWLIPTWESFMEASA